VLPFRRYSPRTAFVAAAAPPVTVRADGEDPLWWHCFEIGYVSVLGLRFEAAVEMEPSLGSTTCAAAERLAVRSFAYSAAALAAACKDNAH